MQWPWQQQPPVDNEDSHDSDDNDNLPHQPVAKKKKKKNLKKHAATKAAIAGTMRVKRQ